MATLQDNKKAALVINTASRKGEASFNHALDLLKQAGFLITPYSVKKPQELTKQIDKALNAGEKLIIVGGGDGTISEIVDQLAYTKVVLGILPLGTANSFSRSLDIPSNLAGAIQIIAAGKTAQIDLGKINDDYFANAVSVGFTSSIAERIPHKLKRYLGILAYGIQGIRNFGELKSFKATIKGLPKPLSLHTYQIVVANGGFYGPAPLVAKSRLQSANISIFTFKDLSPVRILIIWLRSLAGRRFSQQPVQRIEVNKEVVLITHPTQKVSIDGEIKTQTPIRISIAPKALTVLVAESSSLHS